MAVDLILAPEVEEDLAAAYDWYESQRLGLGEDFSARVDACPRTVVRMPEAKPFIEGRYRRALVRRFPDAVIYEYEPAANSVWRERLPGSGNSPFTPTPSSASSPPDAPGRP